MTSNLRLLLEKKAGWVWNSTMEQEFQNVKILLASTPILAPFDMNCPMRLSTDASSFGLGAAILQKVNDEWRPVAYASRAMTQIEQRYAQIEKEALAICWASDKFHYYLAGRPFEVETDHKPLLSILGSKELDKLPLRLQRFRMKMMLYDYNICFTPGEKLVLADMLSRSTAHAIETYEPSFDDTILEALVEALPMSSGFESRLHASIKEDLEGALLLEYLTKGWPDKKGVPETVRNFFEIRHNLTVINGLIYFANRLYIPNNLRKAVLTMIHSGHLGEVKCLRRASNIVWWPKISVDIRKLIKDCRICEEFRHIPKEPLITTSLPERPWWRLAADFFEWKGQHYLVLVDYFSRYILCRKLQDTSATSLISVMQEWLSTFGIPHTLVSDNGSQFISDKFQTFLKLMDVTHITSSPRYPQSNGEAERAVQTVKKLLNKNDNLHMALCAYRDSPLQNGYSPAQLLFGRSMHSIGVSHNSKVNLTTVQEFERNSRQYQKNLYDSRHRATLRTPLQQGDPVKIQDTSGTRTGVVIQTDGREVLIGGSGSLLRRNRALVARIPEKDKNSNSDMRHHDPVGSKPLQNSTTDTNKRYHDPVGSQSLDNNNTRTSKVSGRIIKPRSRLNL